MFFGQPMRARALVGIAVSYAGLALIFTTNLGALGTDLVAGVGPRAFRRDRLRALSAPRQAVDRPYRPAALHLRRDVRRRPSPVLIQFALTQPLGSLVVRPKLFAYRLLLAIGATVPPSFLLNIALQRISAQANSTIGTVSPVITIVLAVLLLGEPLTGTDLIGAMLVLAGVGWFTLARTGRRRVGKRCGNRAVAHAVR